MICSKCEPAGIKEECNATRDTICEPRQVNISRSLTASQSIPTSKCVLGNKIIVIYFFPRHLRKWLFMFVSRRAIFGRCLVYYYTKHLRKPLPLVSCYIFFPGLTSEMIGNILNVRQSSDHLRKMLSAYHYTKDLRKTVAIILTSGYWRDQSDIFFPGYLRKWSEMIGNIRLCSSIVERRRTVFGQSSEE